MGTVIKRCIKCSNTKSIDQFQKQKHSKDGSCCYCKNCKKEMLTRWRKQNPEKMKISIIKLNEWKLLNPEKASLSSKKGLAKWRNKILMLR